MKIILSAFRGENRALHPLSLPEGVGVTSLPSQSLSPPALHLLALLAAACN